MTRRPFYRQIRANRLRLGFFLLVFAAAAVVAGTLVGLVVEPFVAPGAHEARFQYGQYVPWLPWSERSGLTDGYPFNAVGAVAGLFLSAAIGYCWWVVERGGGAILALTGASRLQEARLRNTAEEMGIAAGLDRPVRVWIVEDDSLNAFACRDPAGRGAIVITRGLLRRLERDELQAVMAHETAHLVNGDTTLMTLLFGVSRVLDVVLWVGFFGFRFLAWVAGGASAADADAGRGGGEGEPHGGDAVVGAEGSDPGVRRDRVRRLRREMEERPVAGLAVLVLLGAITLGVFAVVLAVPVILVFTAVSPLYWILLFALPLALLLLRLAISRNREFQADATAVSLSRNPSALRRALERLRADRTPPTRLRPSVAHLCVAPLVLRHRPGGGLRTLEGLFLEEGTILPAEDRAAVYRHVATLPLSKRPVAWIYAVGMTGAPVARALGAALGAARLLETHPPLEERIERVGAMG